MAVILAGITTALIVIIWLVLRFTILGKSDSATIQNPVDFEKLDIVIGEAANQIGEGREELRTNDVFDEESFQASVEAENSPNTEESLTTVDAETDAPNENQTEEEIDLEASSETQTSN